MRMTSEQVAALPRGAPVWLVGTRDPEGQAPWQTAVSADLPRLLAYGEWAAFRTESDAWAWHYDRLARWARVEAARLLKVARDAEKRAKAVKP